MFSFCLLDSSFRLPVFLHFELIARFLSITFNFFALPGGNVC